MRTFGGEESTRAVERDEGYDDERGKLLTQGFPSSSSRPPARSHFVAGVRFFNRAVAPSPSSPHNTPRLGFCVDGFEMPPKTRSTPRRGKAVAAAASTPPTADRRGSPRASPAGGISKLPSGRYIARVDGDTVGTFDTLEEAAAAMTQATMHKVDARSTPVATPVARRVSPPARVTPEQAARRSLPDPEEADADPSASAPQTGTLHRPFLARHPLLALLAILLAVLAATRPNISLSRDSAATSAAPASGCASAATLESLAGLAPPAWGETMEAFLDAAREANANLDATDSKRFIGARKGVALALIVADAAAARCRADDVLGAFSECTRERCALRLDADELVAAADSTRDGDGDGDGRAAKVEAELEARGEAQRRLSTFLAACPGGVVVVSSAEALTPPLLSAILPAVSEGGRFMRDGGEIRADRAAYVFVAAGGKEAGEGGAWRELDDAGFARRAKDALAAGWGSEEDGVVRAFRRRIDFVAPLR